MPKAPEEPPTATTWSVRQARSDDICGLAMLAAPLQLRPERHIVYLDSAPDTIEAEVEALGDDWAAVSAVAERTAHGELVGWLVGEVDPEMGRVWWHGPFVAANGPAGIDDEHWAPIADDLYLLARSLLPATVDQEEFAIDPAFGQLERWAALNGFAADPESVLLLRSLEDEPEQSPTASVRVALPADAKVVAPLHDQLFPGTHTPGRNLLDAADDTHLRLAVDDDNGIPVGYVAVERTPNGEAYIDFLGVDPEHRGRGRGRELVRAALAAGRDLGSVRAALTVRTDNAAALALYRSLGFEHQQVLRPLRRGFSQL